MALFRARSLYITVVLPVVLLVLASMGVVAWAAMRAMREGVRIVAEQRAKYALAYTKATIEDVEHAMMADHGIKLGARLGRLAANPDLDGLRILSVKGKILHSAKSSEVGAMMPSHLPALPDPLPADRDAIPPQVKELPEIVHAATPIFNRRRCAPCHENDQRILGFLDVDISMSRQTAGMRTWAEMAGVTTLAQFVLIAAGIGLVLGFVVIRPIQRLERAMGEVRLGNYAVSAAPAGTKEIDSLVSGFNEMIGRLKRGDELERETQQVKMLRAEQLANLGEWAAGLAHELRNPLSGIKAAVDVLAGEERAEEPKRILRNVSTELARVDGVVKQLLNFARPKAPVVAPFDLGSVLNDAVMLSRPRASAKGAALETTLPASAVMVLADVEMVQQVVLNLVLNALEAAEGGPAPRVALSLEVAGSTAWCRVKDNGPGVAADRVPALFRPFSTTKAHGTGLGLATSRRQIELQGGELILENPGKPGASFGFSLPLAPGAPNV
jgi:hypothetical protein